MNRTRRLTALTFLIAPALAVGPALAAQASALAPGAASRGSCHVEQESNGSYHLWGTGFGPRAKVTYSGSAKGKVTTDHTGRFDVDGLKGKKFTVTPDSGKTKITCSLVEH